MKKKNKLIIFALITTLIIGCIIGSTSMIFPAVTPVSNGPTSIVDENTYVKVQNSDLPDTDYKIITYDFKVGSLDEEDDGSIEKGTIISSGNYLYVYGYYWNSATEIAETNVNENDIKNGSTKWKEMPNNIGWGVAVTNKNEIRYDDMYAKINGKNVTYITNCFANCKNLIFAPILPNFAVNTDNCFLNCENLISVELPREGASLGIMNSIGKDMFKGCKELTNLYIPSTITSINENGDLPFEDCDKLQLYVERSYGYTGSWNSGSKGTPKYNQTIKDYLMSIH